MTTEINIPAELIALQSAYVDKLAAQPQMELSLSVYQTGTHLVNFYTKKGYDVRHTAMGDSPASAIRAAWDYVKALPEHDTLAKQEWHKSLGKVIDEGHALNLPDEVMSPIRAGSQAMSENLLAAPMPEGK